MSPVIMQRFPAHQLDFKSAARSTVRAAAEDFCYSL